MGGPALESVMYRVNIIYPGGPGARFDWEHYLKRHLPLAVGTSMRHSAVAGCDVDRPLASQPESPHRCVCVVRFDGGMGMEQFRGFFVSGHSDTQAIIEDELHYTDIHPRFVCAVANRQGSSDKPAVPAGYRVRVLFPAVQGGRFDFERFRWVVEPRLVERLARHAPIRFTELDRCTAGLAPGSAPDYDVLWTLYFENAEAALKVAARMHGSEASALGEAWREVTGVAPGIAEILASNIVPFDLQEAAPVARGEAAHTGR
jgi:hypothetical protein